MGSFEFYFVGREIPFVDDTGMKGNVDFTFEADMTNMEDIRVQLRKQGFDLVEGESLLDCIVIRDASDKMN